MKYDVKLINESCETGFEELLKEYLNNGYKIESSSVGFVNSENYNFCGVFMALMVKCLNN
jgi:hypothetical protein